MLSLARQATRAWCCRYTKGCQCCLRGERRALGATYRVDGGVLKLVFLFVVEDKTVFFDEADDRRLPARALQEGYQAIEDPVLTKANRIFSLAVHRTSQTDKSLAYVRVRLRL